MAEKTFLAFYLSLSFHEWGNKFIKEITQTREENICRVVSIDNPHEEIVNVVAEEGFSVKNIQEEFNTFDKNDSGITSKVWSI
tara:strand:- start:9 stop:257 length:249 start_codon:yes stop_codon:yes gene_type:complete